MGRQKLTYTLADIREHASKIPYANIPHELLTKVQIEKIAEHLDKFETMWYIWESETGKSLKNTVCRSN